MRLDASDPFLVPAIAAAAATVREAASLSLHEATLALLTTKPDTE